MRQQIFRALNLFVLGLFATANAHAVVDCQRVVNAFSKMAVLINEGMIRGSGSINRYIYSNRKENSEEQSEYIHKTFAKVGLDLATTALNAYETDLCKKGAGGMSGASLTLANTTNCTSLASWVDFLEFDSAAVQKDFYAAIKEMWLISGGEEDPEKWSWTDCQLRVKELEVDRVRKR